MEALEAFYPILTIVSMVGGAWLGHWLAGKRRRNRLGWGLAGAFFPPLLVVLYFLSTRSAAEAAADDDVDGEDLE